MSLPPLDPAIALALICRLGTDDAFRALFVSDPAAALVEIGMSATDAAALGVCCEVNELAEKGDILEAKQELQDMFTSLQNQTVPALDANPEGSRTLKGP
jgi:putative modified peptide